MIIWMWNWFMGANEVQPLRPPTHLLAEVRAFDRSYLRTPPAQPASHTRQAYDSVILSLQCALPQLRAASVRALAPAAPTGIALMRARMHARRGGVDNGVAVHAL